MKKITSFLLVFLLVSTTFAQKLSVFVDYKSDYTANNEPYLEISAFINGTTLKYAPNEKGQFQAAVRIMVKALQNDSLIAGFDYILESELFENEDASTKPHFGDIQNLKLPNGQYLLLFTVYDVNANAKPVRYSDVVVIDYPENEVSISDISLYKTISRETTGDIFDKYGFALEPVLYGYVPETMFSLPFSCEIYNTDKFAADEQITIKSYITGFENDIMPYPEARYVMQTTAKPVVIAIGEIGIFKLPSGNYNLVVDVLHKDSLLVASNTYFFQRSNPNFSLQMNDFNTVNVENTFVDQIKDTVQLLEYVRFLFPISTPVEKDFYILRMNTISAESLKKFFYAFWLKRDPVNPENAWLEYLAKVKHANKEFGCKLVQGYRTDRGRVYLQYGPPTSIVESPFDSHSYPYEIWHYYYCVDQSNVKFVFWNTDLVSNDYELLHSDKRGEMQDPMWQIRLTQRKTPIYNTDQREPEDYFGGNPKNDWKYH
jgi:GWxTD domain-containing protein